MKVSVKLFNQLRVYAPRGSAHARPTLPPGAQVADLLARLNIPAAVQRTVLVNGRRAEDDTPLADGDDVVLMSPIEGG